VAEGDGDVEVPDFRLPDGLWLQSSASSRRKASPQTY